jgi:hypothetical protein
MTAHGTCHHDPAMARCTRNRAWYMRLLGNLRGRRRDQRGDPAVTSSLCCEPSVLWRLPAESEEDQSRGSLPWTLEGA